VPDRPRRLEAPVRVAGSVPQTGDDRQVASAEPPLLAPTFHSYNRKLVEKLVIGEGAPSVMVEEYRRLAALLHNSQIAHGTKIVMISSAAPEEGKTLTASNLAITLSQSFMRRVLLIDADLREPSVHSVFDVENAAGLIHVLKDAQAGITDRRVPLVEVSPRLKVLLSGGVTHDPTALLTSDVLQKLLQDASEVFDWIIIDTPPAALVPDCNLIAGTVDAALLVIRAYATPYPLVQRAVEAIGRERILGVVMNRTEHTVGGDYRYLYEYGYGYGYGYGSENRPPRA
jgi:capsular exopolysaccharide synthesis family protein